MNNQSINQSMYHPGISPQRISREHVARVVFHISKWRHDMETLTASQGPLGGESTGHPWIPLTRGRYRCFPLQKVFDIFFDVSLNKLLNKESNCRWFETPWRHFDCVIFLVGWQRVRVVKPFRRWSLIHMGYELGHPRETHNVIITWILRWKDVST